MRSAGAGRVFNRLLKNVARATEARQHKVEFLPDFGVELGRTTHPSMGQLSRRAGSSAATHFFAYQQKRL